MQTFLIHLSLLFTLSALAMPEVLRKKFPASARSEHSGVIMLDGKMLVTGDRQMANRITEVFDPKEDTWSKIADSKIDLSEVFAILLKKGARSGQTLVIGTTGYYSSLTLQFYDPIADAWSTGTATGERHGFQVAELSEDRILIIGGVTGLQRNLTAIIFDATNDTWIDAGQMQIGRRDFQATVLKDGRVLVTGGSNSDEFPEAHAEIYDPVTNTWSGAGDMHEARYKHTATLLLDGRVLVAGGSTKEDYATKSEIYDPVTNAWSIAPRMNFRRFDAKAVLLKNGTVLVAGGDGETFLEKNRIVESTEVYDPLTNQWTTKGSMSNERVRYLLLLLNDGRVMAYGGHHSSKYNTGMRFLERQSSFDIYNPIIGNWTNPQVSKIARAAHSANVLPDGRVLLAGGRTFLNRGISDVEFYNPIENKIEVAPSMIDSRYEHHALNLPSGKIMVFGGYTKEFNGTTHTEFFNPNTKSWSVAPSTNETRTDSSAVQLRDGRLMVIGGFEARKAKFSAEIYDESTNLWTLTAPMHGARTKAAVVVLSDGRVMVAGGGMKTWLGSYWPLSGLNSVEIYDPKLNTWTELAPLLWPRIGALLILTPTGQILAMAGGYDAIEGYDFATNTWTTKGWMKTRQSVPNAIYDYNGKLWIVGGDGHQDHSIVETYNEAADSFNPEAPLADQRRESTATLLLDGRIYIHGGWSTQFGFIPFSEIITP